jgi:oligopeptide/dipeptide ABC transporter ATP-binding protein
VRYWKRRFGREEVKPAHTWVGCYACLLFVCGVGTIGLWGGGWWLNMTLLPGKSEFEVELRQILEVRELCVAYGARGGAMWRALSGVSFGVGAGEILAVLGESGSGKSTLAASLLRLLPRNARITGGEISLEGTDVAQMSAVQLRRVRGSGISIIFQEPSLALHPTIRVGEQIGEVLRAHGTASRRERVQRARETMAKVFSGDVERIYSSYPHELSGGQQQRVLIAQAIACKPALVVADEPTASLDTTTQREILTLFKRLRDDLGIAFIFITHNPALLAGFADRVLLLYAGKVAEVGPTHEVLLAPKHPYTQALLKCVPQVDGGQAGQAARRKSLLPVIAGAPPSLAVLLQGCVFEPRCQDRMETCQIREPAAAMLGDGHEVACLKFPA